MSHMHNCRRLQPALIERVRSILPCSRLHLSRNPHPRIFSATRPYPAPTSSPPHPSCRLDPLWLATFQHVCPWHPCPWPKLAAPALDDTYAKTNPPPSHLAHPLTHCPRHPNQSPTQSTTWRQWCPIPYHPTQPTLEKYLQSQQAQHQPPQVRQNSRRRRRRQMHVDLAQRHDQERRSHSPPEVLQSSHPQAVREPWVRTKQGPHTQTAHRSDAYHTSGSKARSPHCPICNGPRASKYRAPASNVPTEAPNLQGRHHELPSFEAQSSTGASSISDSTAKSHDA